MVLVGVCPRSIRQRHMNDFTAALFDSTISELAAAFDLNE